MTVTVTGDIADATGQPDSRDWEAWSPVYRAGTNTVVTMRPQPVRVVGGQFIGEFEPGPVLLKNPEGQQFYITVPDADANLGDLIAVATGVPPDRRPNGPGPVLPKDDIKGPDMTLLKYAAVLTGSVIAGVVIAGGGAYLYLMGYTPMFEERLHHF